MQRVYLSEQPANLFKTDSPEIHHQFSRVLRSRVGDEVLFFGDNWGKIYQITEITKRDITFHFQKEISVPVSEQIGEKVNITLFQSIPNKLEKVEYIIQKGVEIGIEHFVFFRAERSQELPLLIKKFDRIQEIAREALEQSGGFQLPKIEVVDSIDSLLSICDVLAVFHTISDVRTKTLASFVEGIEKWKNIGLLVGPEGGFSSSEIEKYIQKWAIPVSLGGRILRTETAGLVGGFYLMQ